MSDEFAQFLVTIYELCLAAELGHLYVEVETRSGQRHIGIPAVDDELGHDWPYHGLPATVDVDHTPLALDQITSCTIYQPPSGQNGRIGPSTVQLPPEPQLPHR
jgi:hypothetical protein